MDMDGEDDELDAADVAEAEAEARVAKVENQQGERGSVRNKQTRNGMTKGKRTISLLGGNRGRGCGRVALFLLLLTHCASLLKAGCRPRRGDEPFNLLVRARHDRWSGAR